MKKVIRLTESDLQRIVKKVIKEQGTKPTGYFEAEYRLVRSNKLYSNDGDKVNSEPFKMPDYFKPYIGHIVSEVNLSKSINDTIFGGEKPLLKIRDLRPAYIDKNSKYNPEKSGFEGVLARVDIGTNDGWEFFYYDCKGKQWKVTDKTSSLKDKSLFNKGFFELGTFIQNKFCNSSMTKPK